MKKVLFIHHSTGGNLIHQGHLRELMKREIPEIEFWDHSYNLSKHIPIFLVQIMANRLFFYTGLTDSDGKVTGTDYAIQLGNDNPADYIKILTLPDILSYDVIIFKNCFPTTKIDSDERLERYKNAYLTMKKTFDNYPGKLFIPFTPPPLRETQTKKEYAERAKLFAQWLKEEFHQSKNVKVFDFFNLHADNDGYLKKEYCPIIPIDSHPNRKANQTIAPILVRFLKEAISQ